MKDDQDVFMAKTGGDGEVTSQVSGGPVFSRNGMFISEPGDRPGCERGVDGEGAEARAGARDGSGDGAKNGIRVRLCLHAGGLGARMLWRERGEETFARERWKWRESQRHDVGRRQSAQKEG